MLPQVQEMLRTTDYRSFPQVQEMLRTTDYRSFPIVENSHSMVFLGSIRRVFLERALKEALHYSGGVTNTVSIGKRWQTRL